MKKFTSLCITATLILVGCSDNTKNKTESSSDIEASVVTDNFDGEQKNMPETNTTTTAKVSYEESENISKTVTTAPNPVKTTEMPIDEKEFIVTEKNEEKINAPVSTEPNIKPNQSIVSTTVLPTSLPTSATNTTAKTYTTTVTQMPEKQPETTEAETKSGIIELPFVPVR